VIKDILISEIKLIDNTPFPYEQAFSFADSMWEYVINDLYEKSKCCNGNYFSIAHTIHSIYRVQSFIDSFRNKKYVPPIILFEGNRLFDGRHRIWAKILLGEKTIRGIILDETRIKNDPFYIG